MHGMFVSSQCTRRRFLTAGLAGLGLADLLRLQRLEASVSAPEATADNVIFIVLSGGPGQHETFDPKPSAPVEIRGQYQAIQTASPGVLVSEMLPRLAERTEKYTLVRSMSHADTVHVSAAHTMLTGQPNGTPADNSPFLGALVSKFRPSDVAMPSYVWLHNMKTGTNKVPRYDSGLSVIGHQHAALHIGHELDNPAAPGFRVREFDPPTGVSFDRLQSRRRLLETLSPEEMAGGSFDRFQERAWELLTGPRARAAFDVEHESAAMRERYGMHPLGQYCLMARRLVEAGVRLVTVAGWPGLAPGETEPTVTQVWDTHDSYYEAGDNMFGNGPYGMKWALPRLDQALSALLDDLGERGLLERTLVAVAGEFGRTPKFEGEGRGRGHWPHSYTTLLAGGGIGGGQVFGASDEIGAYVTAGRPVSHADFGATLFHALGIPPEQRFGRDGFSFRVSPGEPVFELFNRA